MFAKSSDVRDRLLRTALKQFAAKGYAGTSIQDIVGAARVTKPTLYYYFGSKAGLYRALVSRACDEQLRVLQEAASEGQALAAQLNNLVWTTFQFVAGHREFMRLVFATAFASTEEVPREARCAQKGWQGVEFIQGLVHRALQQGELQAEFDAPALTMAFCGMMNLHVMAHLLHPEKPLTRKMADEVVRIFLRGAARMQDPVRLDPNATGAVTTKDGRKASLIAVS